jgi:hypothetical protein
MKHSALFISQRIIINLKMIIIFHSRTSSPLAKNFPIKEFNPLFFSTKRGGIEETFSGE